MSAQLLDGKAIAKQIKQEISEEVVDFIGNNATVPTLAAILVGEDPASQIYVRNKQRACELVGIESKLIELPDSTDDDELLQRIAQLNKANDVHGILVQLPLPPQISTQRILDAVSPWKDVDAFHPENVGRFGNARGRRRNAAG